jgi:hypothetical protein
VPSDEPTYLLSFATLNAFLSLVAEGLMDS